MQYELMFLYRVIAGDLSPLVMTADGYAGYRSYLRARYSGWITRYRVRFRKRKHHYQLIEWHVVNTAQPESMPAGGDTPLQDADALQAQLVGQAMVACKVAAADVTDTELYSEGKGFTLYLTTSRELHQLTAGEARFYYYLVAEEVVRIQAALFQSVFSQPTGEAIRQYIEKHQYGLFSLGRLLREKLLAGKLSVPVEDVDYSVPAIYWEIYRQVQGLYRFLEEHFSYYVSQSVPLPEWYFSIRPSSEGATIGQLKKSLLESDLPTLLVRCLLVPLDQLAGQHTPDPTALTLHRLGYLRRLLEELLHYRKLTGGQWEEKGVSRLLQELNFNHPLFFDYCTRQIEKELEGAEEKGERLEGLWFQLKRYKQRPSANQLIYSSRHPALRDQIIQWLEEEIRYWEKKQAFAHEVEQQNEPDQGNDKIQTNLSVAELSFLTRVLYETGVFANPQQKDILRIVTRSFASVKQPRISLQSLKARYYDSEESTRRSIRALAQRIIRYVDQAGG